MEELLRLDFTNYFGLPQCNIQNLFIQTNEAYFELEDDLNREIQLHRIQGDGVARFSNPLRLVLAIGNYDKFFSSLPHNFQNNQLRCDILISEDTDYIILGELKNSPKIKKHRSKARKQLHMSLKTLMEVPNIKQVFDSRPKKLCCYFNKHPKSPSLLVAVKAFNRITDLSKAGLRMSHSEIESFNFEFWEFTGNQTFTL